MPIPPFGHLDPEAAYPGAKYPEWITLLGLKDPDGRVAGADRKVNA